MEAKAMTALILPDNGLTTPIPWSNAAVLIVFLIAMAIVLREAFRRM
jgi:hypothetical protein